MPWMVPSQKWSPRPLDQISQPYLVAPVDGPTSSARVSRLTSGRGGEHLQCHRKTKYSAIDGRRGLILGGGGGPIIVQQAYQ